MLTKKTDIITRAFKKFLNKNGTTYTSSNTISDALTDFTMKLETEDTFSTRATAKPEKRLRKRPSANSQ